MQLPSNHLARDSHAGSVPSPGGLAHARVGQPAPPLKVQQPAVIQGPILTPPPTRIPCNTGTLGTRYWRPCAIGEPVLPCQRGAAVSRLACNGDVNTVLQGGQLCCPHGVSAQMGDVSKGACDLHPLMLLAARSFVCMPMNHHCQHIFEPCWPTRPGACYEINADCDTTSKLYMAVRSSASRLPKNPTSVSEMA